MDREQLPAAARHALRKLQPMTLLKHTPGPWFVREARSAALQIVVEPSGFLVATNGKKGPQDVARANAFLIAASPDLLAALKALMPEGWADDNTMDHMPGVKQARLAIIRAEGH